ncbi:adenylate/guanylate cyclase domain-containing protein [Roseibium algae]|uniref:Adenylate/guanylate cyclase domain-containing protein n=1 Tax=Roseibium algae TaxID=3123038 RepID=A0ABU8TI66_9HYPH
MRLKHILRLAPTLTVIIGLLVFLTTSLVLYVQATTSEKVVRSLGGTMVDIAMDAFRNEFASHLDGIEAQGAFTAKALQTGAILIDDYQELATFAYGALAGTPHASLILIISADGTATQVDRGDGDGVFVPRRLPISRLPEVAALRETAQKEGKGFWTPVRYIPSHAHSYVSYVAPVMDTNGKVDALVIIGMSLDRLSEIAANISTDNLTVFLTYGGVDLLAHPDLPKVTDQLSPNNPLIDVAKGPDPFLANLSQHKPLPPQDYQLEKDLKLFVGTTEAGQRRFVVLKDSGEQFGKLPVSIGAHFPANILDQPLDQLSHAITVGLALLGISLLCSGLLAHYIARPIRRAAKGASAVARLDLEAIKLLKPSKVRELNDLAVGFNAMVSGLSAFMRYMPKSLVMKLVQEGRIDAPPEERDLAVLFTDIVGFTSLSEKMGTSETGDFINHHLSLIGDAIDARGGTVDKYIGDSVMAFWGAPQRIETPAVPAAQAAIDIAHAIIADNELRRASGLAPVRVRIGLHSGSLIVGDIGATGRVNYTVIGDTVNIASRLESLGREVDPDAEVIILASGDLGDMLPDTFKIEALGAQKVKGKHKPVDVIRLQI